MSAISARTLDSAEAFLQSTDADYNPLLADSGWMVQRVKDWQEHRGYGRNDVEASDIVIHLVQRAGRLAATGVNVINAGSVGSVAHYGDVHGTVQM